MQYLEHILRNSGMVFRAILRDICGTKGLIIIIIIIIIIFIIS